MRYMSELLCYLVKAQLSWHQLVYQRVCERMAEQKSECCIINNATSEMGNRANKLNSQLTWKNFSIHRPIYSHLISPAELDYSIICHLQPGRWSARSALRYRLLSLFNKLTKWKSIGVSIHILGYVWHCLAHLQ